MDSPDAELISLTYAQEITRRHGGITFVLRTFAVEGYEGLAQDLGISPSSLEELPFLANVLETAVTALRQKYAESRN